MFFPNVWYLGGHISCRSIISKTGAVLSCPLYLGFVGLGLCLHYFICCGFFFFSGLCVQDKEDQRSVLLSIIT